MDSLRLNYVPLNAENGYRVLKDSDPVSWEQPEINVLARGSRSALAVGSVFPDTMPSLGLSVAVFGSSDSQLAERLGRLRRALYSTSVQVDDTARSRYVRAVLGSSVDVKPYPASHTAIVTFKLTCLSHGWVESAFTTVTGETAQGGSFTVAAETGDIPCQDVDVLLAIDSNSKATVNTIVPYSAVSLDLSNAAEIPLGSTYWYRLNVDQYQAGKISTPAFGWVWDVSDDVSQFLSASHPGFVIAPPGGGSRSSTLRVTGATGIRLQYRKVWAF